MYSIKHNTLSLLFILAALSLSGCSPEVGTKQWCENMKSQPSGDWTANQVADYAQQCLLK